MTAVRVNGRVANIGPAGSWSAHATLHRGRNAFTVTARDQNGTTATAVRRVFYAPPCAVPKVVGLSLNSAISAIQKKHCHVGAVAHKKSSRPRHQVLAQRPRGGVTRRSGSKVALDVSG